MLFVPNLLIANPAVLIFLGKDTLNLFFYQIVFTVFLIIISRTIFRKGLKKYESAKGRAYLQKAASLFPNHVLLLRVYENYRKGIFSL